MQNGRTGASADGADLDAFLRWNSGHLLENRTRGAYAEWLVHRAREKRHTRLTSTPTPAAVREDTITRGQGCGNSRTCAALAPGDTLQSSRRRNCQFRPRILNETGIACGDLLAIDAEADMKH